MLFLLAGCNFSRVSPIYADSIQFCFNDSLCHVFVTQ